MVKRSQITFITFLKSFCVFLTIGVLIHKILCIPDNAFNHCQTIKFLLLWIQN